MGLIVVGSVNRDVDMWLRTIVMLWYHNYLFIDKFKRVTYILKTILLQRQFESLHQKNITAYVVRISKDTTVHRIVCIALQLHLVLLNHLCNTRAVTSWQLSWLIFVVQLKSRKIHCQAQKICYGYCVNGLLFTLNAYVLYSNVIIVIVITIAVCYVQELWYVKNSHNCMLKPCHNVLFS